MILNAVFYVLRTGCPWRYLPLNMPPWPSVQYYSANGETTAPGPSSLRPSDKKSACAKGGPRPDGADHQQPEREEYGKGRPCGYDGGKRVKGRKRTILVDTLGLLTAWFVHPANESDSECGYHVVERAEPYTGRENQLWTDSAYRGEFAEWVQWKYGWTVEVVMRTAEAVGFAVQPHR